jgi:Tol biopolymer transport system component
VVLGLIGAAAAGCAGSREKASPPASAADRLHSEERAHLSNLKQLTFGGENAEAYFSFDGRRLILQSTRDTFQCDQQFIMNADGSGARMVSTGKGRTTCGYFFPDGKRILYASTHAASPVCPPKPDFSRGYVWRLFPEFDLYSAADDGSDVRPLAASGGYDAEATVSPDGKKIIFTSTRDGDPELYSMNLDGSDVVRLTNAPGYDGGAFYSYDSSKICFRASRPRTEQEKEDYKLLVTEGLVRPTALEIYVMNADGSDMRQLTSNGSANFCPFFHPSGNKLIFASNAGDPQGRNFDLFLIGVDGTGLTRITWEPTFDGFPMWSPDGNKLVFASNRDAAVRGETNIFIAGWND